MLRSLLCCKDKLGEEMKRDVLEKGFSFKLPLHTYRLQRSNHSGRVRMRVVMYVRARMLTKGHFSRTLFKSQNHSCKTF